MSHCTKCNFVGKYIYPDYINGTNNILIVGESPKGSYEKCLESPSLKNLSKILETIGINLSDCSFTELCKCEIPDRKHYKEVGINCISLLFEQISQYKPNIVFVLGAETAKIFSKYLKLSVNPGEMHRINGISFLFLWHPSPLNIGGKNKNIDILFRYKEELLNGN